MRTWRTAASPTRRSVSARASAHTHVVLRSVTPLARGHRVLCPPPVKATTLGVALMPSSAMTSTPPARAESSRQHQLGGGGPMVLAQRDSPLPPASAPHRSSTRPLGRMRSPGLRRQHTHNAVMRTALCGSGRTGRQERPSRRCASSIPTLKLTNAHRHFALRHRGQLSCRANTWIASAVQLQWQRCVSAPALVNVDPQDSS